MNWLNNGSLIDFIPIRENLIEDVKISPVDSKIFFLANSVFPPNNAYQYDFAKPKVIPNNFRQTPLKGFDETKFHFERLKYNSKDGKQITLIVIKKKDMKGKKPCFLRGYGEHYF